MGSFAIYLHLSYFAYSYPTRGRHYDKFMFGILSIYIRSALVLAGYYSYRWLLGNFSFLVPPHFVWILYHLSLYPLYPYTLGIYINESNQAKLFTDESESLSSWGGPDDIMVKGGT